MTFSLIVKVIGSKRRRYCQGLTFVRYFNSCLGSKVTLGVKSGVFGSSQFWKFFLKLGGNKVN